MATFAPISYTYLPTAPRSKSTTIRRKPAPKQSSVLDKLQRSKLSEATLNIARLAADNSGANELGIRETGTVYNDNNNDDDLDLPSIEQLLYTTLQREGFATEDQPSNNIAFIAGDTTAERGGSLDNESAPGDNSGGSLEHSIVLLGDDDASTSAAEVNDGSPHADNVAADEGLLYSLETSIDLTTPTPLSNSNIWHDVDGFPETAKCLWLAEQEPSTSDPMRHHPSSRASSEPLHHHTSAPGQCTTRVRSEATIRSSARSHTEPLDHLRTNQSAIDEHELVRPVLDSDIFEEGDREYQEERQADEDYDDLEDRQRQQDVKEDVAAALMSGKIGGTHLSSKKDESLRLANHDPSPEASQEKLGGQSDSGSDDEFSNTPKSDGDGGRPHVAKRKRKRPSSPNNSPIHKKRKHHPEQRSTRQHRPRSKPYRRSLKSHSLLIQGSRVAATPSPEGRLPSLAPSAPQTMNTEMPPDYNIPGGSSIDFLPMLTEVTFRPYSQHCCSFTAVVREGSDAQGVSFSQLAKLIEGIGHVGKIDDFTIKLLQQRSFLLTGFSRHTASEAFLGDTTLSTAAEALASQKSKPSFSDDDGLSDSDSESNKDEQGRSSTSKHSRWSDLDEQRLLAYKKENKSWDWIFGKFLGRTPAAVRTRWNMVRPRDK